MTSDASGTTTDITRAELERRLAEIALIDARPREAFEAGRLPGARSLPVAEIPTRAPQVLPDRGAEIVAYCSGPT